MRDKDMPAELTTNDYLIAGAACVDASHAAAIAGDRRKALRYAVVGLKLYAHIAGYNVEAEASTLMLYELIEASSKKRKADGVLQSPAAPDAGVG